MVKLKEEKERKKKRLKVLIAKTTVEITFVDSFGVKIRASGIYPGSHDNHSNTSHLVHLHLYQPNFHSAICSYCLL